MEFLSRSRRALSVCGVAVLALVAAPWAWAHPHTWIDLRTVAIFDDDGRLSALRVHWLFDEFYTMFATDGLAVDGDGVPKREGLLQLARTNLGNLKPYDYFTVVDAGGRNVAFGPVDHFESWMIDGRLGMVFTVPLVTPVDPRQTNVAFSVYDPTYYIEILHVRRDPVVLEGAVPAECRAAVESPNPDAGAVSLAASLDRTESAGDGLGAHFAEWVRLRCG